MYVTVHRPLEAEAHKSYATIADLTKLAADARREADAAKAAQAKLQKARDRASSGIWRVRLRRRARMTSSWRSSSDGPVARR